MTDDEFRIEVRTTLDNSMPSSLLTQIPADSGIFHVADVSIDTYQPMFVSSREGRWNKDADLVKYYASEFDTCTAELGYAPGVPATNRVFEVWKTTKSFSALDISKFPTRIQSAIFGSNEPSNKWNRSHILLDEVHQRNEYQNVPAIYAPSASGLALGIGGKCLAASPVFGLSELVSTGTYDDWKQGKLNQDRVIASTVRHATE